MKEQEIGVPRLRKDNNNSKIPRPRFVKRSSFTESDGIQNRSHSKLYGIPPSHSHKKIEKFRSKSELLNIFVDIQSPVQDANKPSSLLFLLKVTAYQKSKYNPLI
jgi:hypothetical protein